MIKIELTKGSRLSIEQLSDIINIAEPELKDLLGKREYYEARDISIISKTNKREYDKITPNNLVIEPYYRTLSNTMVGYMFTNPIRMASENDQAYLDLLMALWDASKADILNTQLGTDTTIFGVAYELHYLRNSEPRFVKIRPEECIPVYNTDIEPELVAMIRKYKIGDDIYIDLYYDTVIEYYIISSDNTKSSYKKTLKVRKESEANFYKKVPFVVYKNTEDNKSDLEPVITLIDFLDSLVTDDSNEIDRFAELYLILKGARMEKKDLAKAKDKRLIELPKDATAEYLKKEINSQYLGDLKKFVIEEIHKHTGIIDFTNPQGFGNDTSGTALKYRLHAMELLADNKESYFKDGLLYRNILLTDIMNTKAASINTKIGDPNKIEFIFERNLPSNLKEAYEIAIQQDTLGISKETQLEQLPGIDKDTELERIAKERIENALNMQAEQQEPNITVDEEGNEPRG